MRLGINTFLFTSPFTNKSTKLFPQFKKWGFETVEIPVEDPSHIDPAYVKAEVAKAGLVCGTSARHGTRPRPSRNGQEQEASKTYFKALIDQAVEPARPFGQAGRSTAPSAARMRSNPRNTPAVEDRGEESEGSRQIRPEKTA